MGRESAYAGWFDIDWSRDRIVVPVLGDDATLSVQDGELRYFEHRFPLAPGSWTPGDDPGEVHARQHYELVHFSRGNAELNYRRFFAITTLAGVRAEDPAVFAATHELIGDWAADGLAGLRVDHPDGLVDPAGYLDAAARAGARRLDHRREDLGGRRAAAAGLARGRDHRLRRDARGERGLRRP